MKTDLDDFATGMAAIAAYPLVVRAIEDRMGIKLLCGKWDGSKD